MPDRMKLLYKIWKKDIANVQLKNEYLRYTKIHDKVDAKIKYDKTLVENSVGNTKIVNKLEIADSMNKYFCKIGQKLSAKIDKPLQTATKMPVMNCKTIFLNPINSDEVINIINNMKFKNCGVDKINTKTIKTMARHIVEPLVHIFNLSIDTAIWPNSLKMLRLRKTGTKNALNYLTNTLYNNLNASIPTIVTFLHLAKAFDTVDHVLLIEKLYHIGIRGQALDLLKSYLNNRHQKFRINNVEADNLTINR
ncbi:uncharacterized protein LOC116416286 [Nasonia vitripennis]|uniref:Reverse transcriptase domain-containing protein n=1 Tax=Nasonia vitripennis TaxID=7425 RepID=A0A7M7Q167_NASVI|nr:uncharacterized protein LOC116416286 [Nasonia vitripennis]